MSLRRTAVAVLLACVTASVTGCSPPPPEPQATPTPTVAPSGSATPPDADDGADTPGASPPDANQPLQPTTQTAPPASATLAKCRDKPTTSEILTLLRQQDMLARDTQATVTTGPLCATDWQYTVITVAGTDPLQVVTRLTNGKLTVVAAGTDICVDELLTVAPPAIRSAAHC